MSSLDKTDRQKQFINLTALLLNNQSTDVNFGYY